MFLLSDRSSLMSGKQVVFDGRYTARLERGMSRRNRDRPRDKTVIATGLWGGVAARVDGFAPDENVWVAGSYVGLDHSWIFSGGR